MGQHIELVVSYLSNMRQCASCASVRGASSTCKSENYGIPQASVMSSLIIIVYINDIVNPTSDIRITMFADDTSVSCSVYRTMNISYWSYSVGGL